MYAIPGPVSANLQFLAKTTVSPTADSKVSPIWANVPLARFLTTPVVSQSGFAGNPPISTARGWAR